MRQKRTTCGKNFFAHTVPQKNQSLVQEKIRRIFSESRDRFIMPAAKFFLPNTVPQKNQTFVQEKIRCIFFKSCGRFAMPAAKIFLLNGVPTKNQSLVQEKTRCIFPKMRDGMGESAAKKFLPDGRIFRRRAVFLHIYAKNFEYLCFFSDLFEARNFGFECGIVKKYAVFLKKCGEYQEKTHCVLNKNTLCFPMKYTVFSGKVQCVFT